MSCMYVLCMYVFVRMHLILFVNFICYVCHECRNDEPQEEQDEDSDENSMWLYILEEVTYT